MKNNAALNTKNNKIIQTVNNDSLKENNTKIRNIDIPVYGDERAKFEEENNEAFGILENEKRRKINEENKNMQIAEEKRRIERKAKFQKKQKARATRAFILKKRIIPLLTASALVWGVVDRLEYLREKKDLAKYANGKLVESLLNDEEKNFYSISDDEAQKIEKLSDDIKTYKELSSLNDKTEEQKQRLNETESYINECGNQYLEDLYLNIVKGEIAKASNSTISKVKTSVSKEEGITAGVESKVTYTDDLLTSNKLSIELTEALKDVAKLQGTKKFSTAEIVEYYDRMEGVYNCTFEKTKNGLKVVEDKER